MTRGKSLSFAIAIALAGATLAVSPVAFAQYQPPPPGYGPPPGYAPPPPQYAPPPPQYAPPPPAYGPGYYGPRYRRPYRSGLILGFALGGGGISSTDCGDVCGGALAIEGHIGAFLNPRVAIMGDFWLNDHPIPNTDGASTLNSISTFAAQFWLNEFFWLKGGIGVGHLQIVDDNAGIVFSDETGLAVMGAAGVEVVQTPFFAFDLQLRVGHASYSGVNDFNNWALMVGFNWY
jgi:hypothetical protein